MTFLLVRLARPARPAKPARQSVKHLLNEKLHIKHYFSIFFIFAASKLSRGVIGNTSDSGSEEFRFET